MDNDDDDTTVKYMMHGGSTIFVSPNIYLTMAAMVVSYLLIVHQHHLIEWNERGIDVIRRVMDRKLYHLIMEY